MNNNDQPETVDDRWRALYRLGGVSARIIAVLLLGEVAVYSVVPNPGTPLEHIEMFLDSPLLGLLFFDLLGMVAYLFFIPVILSLYMALRRQNESIMLIATVLFFIGVAAFFATNTGFSMLSLSKQYAMAKTEAEQKILLSSCQAMVTLFDVNAFLVSYVIVSAAWLMIGCVMLQSHAFGRFTAYMGILSGASGIIAEILENTSTALIGVAIAFYFAAIVFLFLWMLRSGSRLRHLGSGPKREGKSPAEHSGPSAYS